MGASAGNINEINIIYKIKKYYPWENEIKLFGSEFVKNNKDICKMIIDNKVYNIERFYNVKNYSNNILKIILKGINNITNISYMFYECLLLSSLPDISTWNTNNITDMKYMFYECISLLSLPDISKWNTNNVTNMKSMFDSCSSLTSLPDISKWNIKNLKYHERMFMRCSSSLQIPRLNDCLIF